MEEHWWMHEIVWNRIDVEVDEIGGGRYGGLKSMQ
jgi:hypothetical protein